MRRQMKLPMLMLAASALALATACSSSDQGSEGGEKAGAPKASPAQIARGAEIYKATCAACHGATGKGDGPAAGVLKPPPRDHTDKTYMDTLTDEDMKKIIVMGGAIKGKPLMPSHPQIRGTDLDALVGYVRSLSHPGGN